jgi:hypothetical protein
MAADAAGNVYVAGHVTGAAGVDCSLIKYVVNTYQPLVLAQARYNGPGNGAEQACGFGNTANRGEASAADAPRAGARAELCEVRTTGASTAGEHVDPPRGGTALGGLDAVNVWS